MTNTLIKYKKETDEKLEIERKNRDNLIKQIENYDLADEKYKDSTKQEIMQNFKKHENNVKEDPTYKLAIEYLEDIRGKQNFLRDMREKLKNKELEKADIEQRLRDQKMDWSDKTTLELQKIKMDRLLQQLQIVISEIEEVEKDIKNYETEIEEMEKLYWKCDNAQCEAENVLDTNKYSDSKKKQKSTQRNEPKSLDWYRGKTIKDLRKIDQVRHEIIKLLDEWAWIWDELSKKIKNEISSKFFEFYDEKQWSLRIKAARFQRNVARNKSLEERRNRKIKWKITETIEAQNEEKLMRSIIDKSDFVSQLGNIWWSPLFKARINWKLSIFWGNQLLCEWADDIGYLKDVWWIPVFTAKKHGNCSVIWWNQLLCEEAYTTWPIEDIWWLPCFKAEINWKLSIFWGNQLLCEWADSIWLIKDIWWFPYFKARTDWKLNVFHWEILLYEWIGCVWYTKDVWWKPAYTVIKNWKYYVFWGNQLLCSWTDMCNTDNIWIIEDIWWLPAFSIKTNWKWNAYWGVHILYEGADNFIYIKDVWCLPAFSANTNWEWSVFWGDRVLWYWADRIWDISYAWKYSDTDSSCIPIIQNAWWYPVFSLKIDWKWKVFWGDQVIYEGNKYIHFNDAFIKDTLSAPSFIIWWNNPIEFDIFYWKKCILKWADDMDGKFIWWKFAFSAKKCWKYYMLWGDQIICEEVDYVWYIKELWWLPLFKAEINWERCVFWGNKIIWKWANYISDINTKKCWWKPFFYAKISWEWNFFWGDQVICKWNGVVLNAKVEDIWWEPLFYIKTVEDIWWEPLFYIKTTWKSSVVFKNQIIYEWTDNISNISYIWWKAIFILEKDWWKNVLWWNKTLCKWAENVGEISDIWWKPAFATETNWKWNITWWEDILCKDADNILYLINFLWKPVFKFVKNWNTLTSYPNTPREIRENLILDWAQKNKNIGKLLSFLSSLLDNESFCKLQSEILKDFQVNHEMAKSDKEYQAADKRYKDIQRLSDEHKRKVAELQTKEKNVEKEYNEIMNKINKIVNNAMSLENGSRWKKLKLEHTISEWDQLEARQKKIANDIDNLRKEKDSIELELSTKESQYGPEISIREEKEANISEYTWTEDILYSFDQLVVNEENIRRYREAYDETIKNKENYMKTVLIEIENMDLWISDDIKKNVLEKVKWSMAKDVKILKWRMKKNINLLQLLYKRAQFISNWYQKKKSRDKFLQLLSSYLDSKSFKKIQEELLKNFYVNYEKARMDEWVLFVNKDYVNFKKAIKDCNKSKEFSSWIKYWIENKKNANVSEYMWNDLNNLWEIETTKWYKEKYDLIIKDKENYMRTVLMEIENMDLWISDDIKKKALTILETNMGEGIQQLKKWNKLLQISKEIEEWLMLNWDPKMNDLSEIREQIGILTEKIKWLEQKRKSAKSQEISGLYKEEYSIRQELLSLEQKKEEIIWEINGKLKYYDGTSLNIPEDIELTRHERFKEIS